MIIKITSCLFAMTVVLCFTSSIRAASGAVVPENLADLAVPLQGTDSTRDFSHGNTYPAVALPFPMNVWSAYTQPVKDSFYYQYRQERIRGIRQTHQPSPWIGDYGAFAVMPVSCRLVCDEEGRASVFRHADEEARPYYYRVHLDTWNVTAEVTPTERCAAFRFTYAKDHAAYVVLDAFPGESSVEIQPDRRRIVGWVRNNHGGVPTNFASYFVLQFDRPFLAHDIWKTGKPAAAGAKKVTPHIGAWVQVDAAAGPVTFRVASSFIDLPQAEATLQQEIGGASFDEVRSRAAVRWNETLGRIRVEGGLPDQRRTFYSAFYRSVLYPHKFYEIGADGRPHYFSPYDGRVHEGVLYTDSGFWDTFRSVHPLFNLIFPEVSAEIIQSLLNTYDQSGWLPSWSSPGHRNCMIGNHAFSLFADAWVKGVRNFDTGKAVDAMVHDAAAEGPLDAIGRKGAVFYRQHGYVPYPEVREASARTLEFAYDDFCAAQVARGAGRTAEAEAFERSAMNYRNVWDSSTGFMRGRQSDGTWCAPFDPAEWGGPFTEGCSWHYTWSVFHDIQGLINLMGGDAAFAAKLDAVYAAPPTVGVGTYKKMIHEMIEMVAVSMGQYAHGNEPIQHMIYLYNFAGQPWKAQIRAREAMMRLYFPTPDGLCGDEDTGQTSAWYVFSALGFYPVCPGVPQYVIGSPLFARAELTLPDGKHFVICADRNGPLRPYIASAELNGQPFERTFLTHEEIRNGGAVTFHMESVANEKWATDRQARPFSISAPIIESKGKL